MERSEIQSQWESENSRLQNIRGLLLTLNIVLLSLLRFTIIFDSSVMEIIFFLLFIILGVSINVFWILIQRNIGRKVNSWGLQYFKELDPTDLITFEKINRIKIDIDNETIDNNKSINIRNIYTFITVCFGLIWLIILFFSIMF